MFPVVNNWLISVHSTCHFEFKKIKTYIFFANFCHILLWCQIVFELLSLLCIFHNLALERLIQLRCTGYCMPKRVQLQKL